MARSSFFSTSNPERNFALIVQDTKLWISKEYLASYSPVFRNMFFGDFKEAEGDSVNLPGKKLADVVEFLQCLIPCPIRKNVDKTNLDLMMQFADEYDIEDLKNRCETVLKTILDRLQTTKTEEFFDYFYMAVTFRYKNLIISYLPFAASYPIKIINENRSFYPAHVNLALCEAIMNRKLNQEHCCDSKQRSSSIQCSTCLSFANHIYCSKCRNISCPKKLMECKVYHKNGCKFASGYPRGGDCLCGYTFNTSILDNL